jgi:amidase
MIDRRRFIGTTMAGGASLTLGTGCAPESTEPSAQGAPSPIQPFELDEIDLAALQRSMESGARTARSITELYLQRIEELNRQGPDLRAIIETNPDAVAAADELDAERAAGNVRGPLHGIPVVVKDNIDTADRMSTTAGALALAGNIAQQDAWVSKRLRDAGAILLGKANLSEWANFRSLRSSSGWSGRGGQARNPYSLDRNPSGSSSGSGVAVSANLCPVAIGTETNGSIISPASVSGIVGIKPTVGLVGRSGIIPISHSQDTAGPMARTVRDAALLLGVLTGVDPRDGATQASAGNSHDDYTTFLDPDGLRGARIGVVRSTMGYHEGVDRVMAEAIARMRAGGATVIDVDRVITAEVGDDEYKVLLYEFKDGVNRYLAGMPSSVTVRTLEDVIAFNETNAGEAMPYFGQEILLDAQATTGLSAPEYVQALANVRRASRDEGIDRALTDHRLDAMIAPSESATWTTDLVNGDRYISRGDGYGPAAMAGYPSVTVPMGFVWGLPVGLCFFGRAWAEPTLLRLAYAFEQATQHRTPPSFAEALV